MQQFNPEQAMTEIRREFGEHGGVTPSISRSSTFSVMESETMPEIFAGVLRPEDGNFLYSRHFNPTVNTLARYLAAMEGTEAALCTASGMAAISCTLMQLCSQGDQIISSNTVYGGTHALLQHLLPQMGITTTFVDPTKIDAFYRAITTATKVVYVETMGNPTLKIANLPALAKLAGDYNLTLVVDNTFTPMMISPARLGADIIVYSMTKFVNGASDLIAGAVCTTKEMVGRLMDLHTGRAMLLGPTMDPRMAYDIMQRLPHLAIRMREHSRRAKAMVIHLEGLGIAIVYPGLSSFPQHALVSSFLNKEYGYGGMFTIDCGTREKADQLLNHLQNIEKFGCIAVSLGYFDTLMSCSGSTTSSEISTAEQKEMGLSPGLVRIAVGYTGCLEDRVKQLDRAVKAVRLL
jgi:methionine-gamma-lyase